MMNLVVQSPYNFNQVLGGDIREVRISRYESYFGDRLSWFVQSTPISVNGIREERLEKVQTPFTFNGVGSKFIHRF